MTSNSLWNLISCALENSEERLKLLGSMLYVTASPESVACMVNSLDVDIIRAWVVALDPTICRSLTFSATELNNTILHELPESP